MLVRFPTSLPTDPAILHLGVRLGLSRSLALGHVFSVLCTFAEIYPEAEAGNVDDSTLEEWAQWRGKKGVFAREFRELCVEQDGRVKWTRQLRNDVKRLEMDRQRHKQKPRKRKPSDKELLRAALIEETGNRCVGCGREGEDIPGKRLELHRVINWQNGGQYVRANVRLLCRPCHNREERHPPGSTGTAQGSPPVEPPQGDSTGGLHRGTPGEELRPVVSKEILGENPQGSLSEEVTDLKETEIREQQRAESSHRWATVLTPVARNVWTPTPGSEPL